MGYIQLMTVRVDWKNVLTAQKAVLDTGLKDGADSQVVFQVIIIHVLRCVVDNRKLRFYFPLYWMIIHRSATLTGKVSNTTYYVTMQCSTGKTHIKQLVPNSSGLCKELLKKGSRDMTV